MRQPTQSRGQVLIMACLVMLLLAVTLMASFSVSHGIHERIRIQNAADAQAFSIATIEARGFNTLAYMNRAIAGAIVAEMGLHAWRTIADRDQWMYLAGFISFLQVSAQEFSKCPKFNIQHCIHGIQALLIAFKYLQKWNSAKSDIQGKDQKWKEAVKGFQDMIASVYGDEKKLVDNVKSAITGGAVLQAVKNGTAPEAQMKGLDDMNVSGLACAVEGSSIDGSCKNYSWKKQGSASSASSRHTIMESAANAARPSLEVGRMSARALANKDFHSTTASQDVGLGGNTVQTMLTTDGMVGDFSSAKNPKNMMDVQNNEGEYKEQSLLGIGFKANNNKIDQLATTFALVTVKWKDGNGVFLTLGSPPKASEYQGVPCSGNNCFMNYRSGQASSGKDDDTDYNQPTTYGGFQQDLRSLKGGAKGAWEIGGKGEVQAVGTNKKLKYVSDNNGYAVAKGKTYFHQLGDWSVPPNFFDPFWRPKLHPFKRAEMSAVLKEAGDSSGSQTADQNGAPIEGVVQ